MSGVDWVERVGRLALVGLLLVPVPVAPATIIVGGGCTLPDAIEAANTDSAIGGCDAGQGTDIVRLTADVPLTEVDNNESGPNGLPVVASEIVLEGNGFSVLRDAASPSFRILRVGNSGSLVLSGATIGGGHVSYPNDGGGIHNDGDLVVEGSAVVGNFAGGDGGGIFNGYFTDAVISHSTVSGNESGDDGGGVYTGRYSTTSLEYTEISGNITLFHGGGLMTYGTLTMTAGTVSDNVANSLGGGLSIMYGYGDSTIGDSTLSGNSAAAGGGLFNGFGSYATLTNVTLSGNQASFRGGGLYQEFAGSADLHHVTLAGNGAPTGGGIHVNASDLTLTGSAVGYTTMGGDCSGSAPTDGGGNLSGDGTCPGAVLVGLDPVLADNGGPTLTHALVPGSSAVDAGGACGLLIDQRGFGRDPLCDSGAFELDGLTPVGGAAAGLDPLSARCRNATAGGSVGISGQAAWNCRTEGLAIASGDRVRIEARGRAVDLARGGEVSGLTGTEVLCRNETSGQSVRFPLAGDSAWDCRERGLTFARGDLVRWVAVGIAE